MDKPAKILKGKDCLRPALKSADVSTEWKTLQHYMTKQPKDDMGSQLHEVVTNAMLQTIFPNLNTSAHVCLTIPVGTASVERSFLQIKMIKSRLHNQMNETSLSHLMKLAIESPEKLSNSDLEKTVNVWTRKSRRVPV